MTDCYFCEGDGWVLMRRKEGSDQSEVCPVCDAGLIATPSKRTLDILAAIHKAADELAGLHTNSSIPPLKDFKGSVMMPDSSSKEVWTVFMEGNKHDDLYGIFSTEEKARAYIAKFRAKDPEDGQDLVARSWAVDGVAVWSNQ